MVDVAHFIAQKLFEKFSEEETENLGRVASEVATTILELGLGIGTILQKSMANAVQSGVDYERSRLLYIYTRRRTWKKSDIARLETYRLNKVARNILSQLEASKKGLGRGTIPPYSPLEEVLIAKGRLMVTLIQAETLPKDRLYALQQTPWWPGFVEMTYRGEKLRLQKLKRVAPAFEAEKNVGDSCHLSRERIRQLSGQIRKDASAGHPPSTPIDVADFENWKKTGRLPDES